MTPPNFFVLAPDVGSGEWPVSPVVRVLVTVVGRSEAVADVAGADVVAGAEVVADAEVAAGADVEGGDELGTAAEGWADGAWVVWVTGLASRS